MSELINIQTRQDGLIIGTDQMDFVESVCIVVLVKVGSRNENKSFNGISHFLEHMAFKGTSTMTAQEIAERFDSIGGYFNAYTSREVTVYHTKVLKENVDEAMYILSSIIQDSTYPDDELEKEREVIRQELAQNIDTPDDVVFDYFQEKAYPDQPIGRSILGTTEFLNTVSRDDIIDYVKNYYKSNNMIITAAGNINHNDFTLLVNKHFDKLKQGDINSYLPAKYLGGDVRSFRDLEQLNIVIGLEGNSYLDDDYYTSKVLSMVLGGSMSSRLFQEVREKRGLAYSISAFPINYRDSGLFCIHSGVDCKNANELINIVMKELKKVTQVVTQEELERTKAQIRSSILMGKESCTARAENLAGNIMAHNRHITKEEIIRKVNSIKTEDVSLLMKKIIDNTKTLTIASIGKVDTLLKYEEIKELLWGTA